MGKVSLRLSILFALTAIFMIIELVVGYVVNSLALVSDSFHMLSDLLALGVALWARRYSKKDKTARMTYGWKRAEIVGALMNSVFLLALCLNILISAIQRFFIFEEITEPKLILIVGGAGLAVNIIGMLLFIGQDGGHGHSHGHSHGHGHTDLVTPEDVEAEHEHHSDDHHSHGSDEEHAHTEYRTNSGEEPNIEQGVIHRDGTTEIEIKEVIKSPELGRKKPSHDHSHSHSHVHEKHEDSPKKHKPVNHNLRGILLHLMGDALGSVAVIASALIIWLLDSPHRFYADPAISVFITLIILKSTIPLVRQTSSILLQAAPARIDVKKIEDSVLKIEGVLAIHDIHVWELSSTLIVASIHVTCHRNVNFMTLASKIKSVLHRQSIHASTIQPEFLDDDDATEDMCLLECAKGCEDDTCCAKRRPTITVESEPN
eukprot:TRINITY_DN19331_c0_g1_i1.p1 TRINITY_DN19331_c0_g1~~TRINITY_DN19331_c0_g1_i1.p1  ORF type:complete len:431 (-),score=64.41 TRINITY_DN19331_c0_g1_i1:12-1304(-)